MSYEQLADIIAEAIEVHRAEKAAQPEACPNDGEPLLIGSDGGLFCPFDGWRPDGVA